MREGKAESVPIRRCTELEVDDVWELRHAAACLERVAVEKDVARQRAGVDPGENIGAEVVPDGEARARQRRFHAQRRAKILIEVETKPCQCAAVDVVVDVADRGADMWLEVEELAESRIRIDELVGPLIGDLERGLVAEL